ncbi:MAG: multidrug efflux RND transporter permease subunit [Lentisphaeraceae bacterium]|nr:multidrug efflux RND transporter permease subunit [Lentisphaeraceae bacterium]
MFSEFFINRPKFAFVISIVITLAGLVAILTLPVAQYPEITPPQVEITANFPGASAVDVENSVISPLETQINGVKDMLYMDSKSSNDGSATITVTFDIGTSGDINTVNVQNRVSIATASLPEEVKRQGVTVKEKSSNMLMVVNLYSPDGTYDGDFLSNYTSINVTDNILRIPGVGDAKMMGGYDYAMRIWLDPERMASLSLTPSDVISAVQAQNVQVAAGTIGSPPLESDQQFQYTVTTTGRLSDIDEFKKIVIRSNNDSSKIILSDIARVELGVENYSSFGSLNGKPGVLLAVYQLADANGLDVAENCRILMDRLQTSFPSDVKYEILYDTTKFIKASIDEVIETLFVAVLLVILVVFIFLQDWRSTLIPTVAIPVSLIGTFAVMYALGYTINTISLFGLILAIGVVVDDAIVVLENVKRLMAEEGLDPKAATRKTMKQVSGPVVATTLVLLATFIPVTLLPGISGRIYNQFAVTIAISVLISSLNALTLSPALCACFLTNKESKPFFFFRWFNSFFDWATERYGSIVSFLLRKAIIVILLIAGVFVGTGWLFQNVPTSFVPSEDDGAILADIQLPDGASLNRTKEVVSKAEELIRKTEGVADVMSVTGFSMLKGSNSSNSAFLIIVLEEWAKRPGVEMNSFSILRKMGATLSKIPQGRVLPFTMPPIPGVGSTGGFEFIVQDSLSRPPAEFAKSVNSLIMKANQSPELDRVYTTFRANIPQIHIDLNREKALQLGVSLSEIFQTLQAQLGSFYINDFNIFGKVYKVKIQASAEHRKDLSDIKKLYVRNKTGEMIPMSTLCSLSWKYGPDIINRYNAYRSIKVSGNPAPGYSSSQAMVAMEKLAKDTLPQTMMTEWTGMSYQERLAGSLMIYIFIAALVFIYLFLVAQYESWLIPISVILSVPLAIMGALAAIYFVGIPNGIYVQVGLILLFGISAKTAILIVEFAKENREQEGKSINEAALFAAKTRFRAVMMTALSFILGILPLVIATGAGASSRRSLGTAVFGGMFMAAIVGTVFIPSFFQIIQHTREWGKKLLSGNKS